MEDNNTSNGGVCAYGGENGEWIGDGCSRVREGLGGWDGGGREVRGRAECTEY